MEKNFIKTSDQETAEMLKKENLELIDFSNGIYTFINKPSKKFNSSDNLKLTYSNMLCV